MEEERNEQRNSILANSEANIGSKSEENENIDYDLKWMENLRKREIEKMRNQYKASINRKIEYDENDIESMKNVLARHYESLNSYMGFVNNDRMLDAERILNIKNQIEELKEKIVLKENEAKQKGENPEKQRKEKLREEVENKALMIVDKNASFISRAWKALKISIKMALEEAFNDMERNRRDGIIKKNWNKDYTLLYAKCKQIVNEHEQEMQTNKKDIKEPENEKTQEKEVSKEISLNNEEKEVIEAKYKGIFDKEIKCFDTNGEILPQSAKLNEGKENEENVLVANFNMLQKYGMTKDEIKAVLTYEKGKLSNEKEEIKQKDNPNLISALSKIETIKEQKNKENTIKSNKPRVQTNEDMER